MTPGSTQKTLLTLFLVGGILLQLIPCRIYAQQNDGTAPNFTGGYNTISIYGMDHGKGGEDVNGTPLFTSVWKQGLIRLADGRTLKGVPVLLDLENQVLRYRQTDGSEQSIQQGFVKEVIILDTVGTRNVTFRFITGYPPIDNQTISSFYLLLDSGKVSFLESVRKRYIEKKNDYTSETSKEYRTYEDFYVFVKGQMIRIKKDEKFFLELTGDKQAQMDEYLKTNKISFKSEENIRQFIHYYNGLP